MFFALDASYSVDPHPSGIAVYSRELMDGLAKTHPEDEFVHLYRPKQFSRRGRPPAFSNVRSGLLLPAVLPWPRFRKPRVFHALNQRVDSRPAQRVVSTFHDLFVMSGEYSTKEFRDRFTRQAREAAQKSDLIIAVSEFTKRQVMDLLQVEASRVRVVGHGVDLPDSVMPTHSRQKMILSVGALQVRKNFARLVEAFEALPDSVAEGWRMVFAGSTGGYGAEPIMDRIRQSCRAQNIELRGYVTAAQLAELYNQAAIFAFPSLDEGFGIPVLEAMAHGVPVLTSNRSALPEVTGNAGILVDPYSAAAIAAGLELLMCDEETRARLQEAGREQARIFPWSRTVESTYAIYRELTPR